MRSTSAFLLLAVGILIHAPRVIAADESRESQPLPAVRPSATGLTLQPSQNPYDVTPGADEISSVQVPAAQSARPPVMLDLTAAPTSLWTRIRLGFGLPDVSSALVKEQEDWFANRPDYIKRTIARSSRYLHYITEELQKRRMPTEIALLPIIESAYNPVAYSRAHASGIWQFIPSTGKNYGLQQNYWYDGRRDVIAATTAALDYLQKLYDMFGSWDLALASYNWGEGAVGRAIAKNQARGLPTDYQSLTMPNETRYYIPKLQAIKNIIANPAQFGIDLADVPNQPYFTTVTTNKDMDVKVAAKLAGMPVDDFRQLNPGHNRVVIRANNQPTLLLPADRADTFRANLDNHVEPLVSWQLYTMRAGDRLDRIAARHRITVEQLKQASGISGQHRVAAGTTLMVPAGTNATPHLPDLPAPSVAAVKAPKKAGKTVQARGKSVASRSASAKGAQTRKLTRKPTPAQRTASHGNRKMLVAQRQR